jgi:hypothetical protein
VSDVGHQIAPLAILRLEPGRHAVEGAREGAHPSRAALGCARAVIAGGDASRRLPPSHRAETRIAPSVRGTTPGAGTATAIRRKSGGGRIGTVAPADGSKPRNNCRQSDRNEDQSHGKQNAHSSGEPCAMAPPGVRAPCGGHGSFSGHHGGGLDGHGHGSRRPEPESSSFLIPRICSPCRTRSGCNVASANRVQLCV